MNGLLLASGGEAPPRTIFTPLWEIVKETSLGQWFEFDEMKNNLGQFWFEAICFCFCAALFLVLLSAVATRKYQRVPRGVQNLLEWAVGLLRGLVRSFIGESGDKYLPYLGTIFLFIFIMNVMGLVPLFRSPTMTLSTTAALGVVTFIMVQFYAVRATGLVTYLKHFMGDILWLAPLMIVVEIVGEFARPVSLSLRLFGNIFGEDMVIEKLLHMGQGFYLPLQIPMMAFAIFGSFLQAFIFTCLASLYIGQKVAHEEGHGEESHGH